MIFEKCKHCVKDCPYRDDSDDSCWFVPNDYPDGDIGTATAKEVIRQNEMP